MRRAHRGIGHRRSRRAPPRADHAAATADHLVRTRGLSFRPRIPSSAACSRRGGAADVRRSPRWGVSSAFSPRRCTTDAEIDEITVPALVDVRRPLAGSTVGNAAAIEEAVVSSRGRRWLTATRDCAAAGMPAAERAAPLTNSAD